MDSQNQLPPQQPLPSSPQPPAQVTPLYGLPQPGQGPVVIAAGQQTPASKQASKQPDRKMLYIIGGISAAVIIIIIVVIVLAGGSSGKKAAKTPAAQQSQGPAPATSFTLQQDVDSINQNLSSLNDTTDFPASALSDNSLGGN